MRPAKRSSALPYLATMLIQNRGVASSLRIDELAVPGVAGRLGLLACPGAAWAQPDRPDIACTLAADLDAVVAWGARTLVTLMEWREFARAGVEDLPRMAERRLQWVWLPVPDGKAPDERFAAAWPGAGHLLRARLAIGERIAVHCLGGLGRTGMLAAQLLMEHGLDARLAMATVRAARPGSIETRAQVNYLLGLDPSQGHAERLAAC